MKEKITDSGNSSDERFLIDAIHEMRSPLTRLKLACEFIEDENLKKKIGEDVKEIESMINGLLESYRIGNTGKNIKTERIDLNILLESVISKFRSERLKFRNDSDGIFIYADKTGMETVFRNIIDNSLKYTEKSPVEIKIFKKKNFIIVSFKDKGEVISENELEKIFEPFYRSERSIDKNIPGFGLGLSIVKKILEGHGFIYEFKILSGEGTEFTIQFPSDDNYK